MNHSKMKKTNLL